MCTNEKKICKNCGAEFMGAHCPDCGQAANIERFTVKGTLKDTYLTLFVADSSFYRTITSLFYRPGHMVREYLTGERLKYLKPIKMLMVLVAVYIIVVYFVGLGESQDDAMIRQEVGRLSFLGGCSTYIIAFLQNKVYGSLFQALLCTLPFALVFRKCKITFKDKNAAGEPVVSSLNLAEHFYTVVYISCQLVILSYIEILLRLFFGYGFGNTEGIVISLFLYTLCYKQLLGISWGKALWKVIVGMALATILLLVALVVIILIAGLFVPNVIK